MPLWGASDANTNSDKAATLQYNMGITPANANLLYQNTTAGAFIANLPVGQFCVSNAQAQADASGHGYHAGWVLRKVGAGLRAGRVTYETLVAGGTYGSGSTGNAQFPNYRIVINTPPSSNSGNANLNYTVVASSLPVGATLNYKWQQSYAGATAWADIPNTAGVWFNNTSPTFTANGITANANTLRVLISSTSSVNIANVYTANVTVIKAP